MSKTAVSLLCVVPALVAAGCGDDGASDRWRDYIRGDRYTRLVIEVDFVTGTAPLGNDRLTPTLSGLLDKPDGIEIVVDDALEVESDGVWSLDELADLMDRYDDVPLDDKAIKMNTVIVDGRYAGEEGEGSVLGLAWGGHRIVLFADSIADACSGPAGLAGPLPPDLVCVAVRNSVWMHEIGHLLGLVDNGLPMVTPHRDPDPSHGVHDVNEECLMHWSTNRRDVVHRVVSAINGGAGENPLEFGDACKADIAAIRDAAP